MLEQKKHDMLKALRLPDPTAIQAGELARSVHTRQGILDAGIDCLAELGYAHTTTTTVADRAGLTRAAMLYHFPSRIALIEAVGYHATRKRIEMYYTAMAEIPQDEHFMERAIDTAWEQLQTNTFKAFSELSVASRTDPELANVFQTALLEFDRARRETALALFPQSYIESEGFDVRRDISRFLLEGLAAHGGLAVNAAERTAAMINFLKVMASAPEGKSIMEKVKKMQRKRPEGGRTAVKKRSKQRA